MQDSMNGEMGDGGAAPARVRPKMQAGVSIRASVGDRIQLKTTLMKKSVLGKVVGLEPYEFLIAKLPMVPGLMSMVMVNSDVTVSYENSGTVYGFAASVRNFVMKPAPLAFLSYPESVSTIDLRRERRSRCFFPAVVHGPNGPIPSVITDISPGGCRFALKPNRKKEVEMAQAGNMVVLQLKILDGTEHMVNGIIRSVSKDVGSMTLGVQFQDIEPDLARDIGLFLDAVSVK